jgi:sugar lactone lactonase YvrE
MWPTRFLVCIVFTSPSSVAPAGQTALPEFLMHRASTSLFAAAALACASLVAIARGETVYVTSRYSGSVLSFQIGASLPASPVVSSTIASGLALPTGLAFDAAGRLFIVEAGLVDPDTQQELVAPGVSRSVSGTGPQRIIDLPDTQPAAIVVAANGDLIVGSLSQGGTAAGSLQGAAVFRIADVSGTSSASPYSSVAVPGLVGAAGLALDGSGRLYIANGNGYSGAVVRLASGTSADLTTVIAAGTANDQVDGPTALLLDGTTLYASSVGATGGQAATVPSRLLGVDITAGSFAPTTLQSFSIGGFNPYLGPLAELADGRLLAGSLNGTGTLFLLDPALQNPLLGSFTVQGLDQVGGIAVVPVPEPTGLGLLVSAGVAGAAILRRRRRR